jgi:Opioid growth factor receptor (OGFr) conserved region
MVFFGSNLMSRLVDFYRGVKTDIEGRLLMDVLAWPDDDLEEVHDFIQWLFPLPEPSQYNSDAPLLTNEDIAAFKSDPVLQANLMKSFERILAFFGLALSDGKVVVGQNFTARVADAWASPNHNWLRISRIFRSLTLLGMEAHAQALYEWLGATYTSREFPISADTIRYWTEAVRE